MAQGTAVTGCGSSQPVRWQHWYSLEEHILLLFQFRLVKGQRCLKILSYKIYCLDIEEPYFSVNYKTECGPCCYICMFVLVSGNFAYRGLKFNRNASEPMKVI